MQGYCNGQQSQSTSQDILMQRELWLCLVDHGVYRNEMDDKCTKFLLDMYWWRGLNQVNNTLNHQNREFWSLSQGPDLSQFIDPELLQRRESQVPLRKDTGTLPKSYTVHFPHPSPKGPAGFYQGNSALGERK